MKRIKVTVKTVEIRTGVKGLEVTGPDGCVYGINTGSVGPYGTSTGVFASGTDNFQLRIPTAGEHYLEIY